MKFNIPPEGYLPKTAEDDPIVFHYMFPIGWFYIKRLKMVAELLGMNGRYDNILEIGFGSGVFMPELSKRCKRLYGLDIHDNIKIVKTKLNDMKVFTEPVMGSMLEIPFKDNCFDAIVSISALEHIVNLELVINEIKRVLKDDGVLVVGFPVKNFITDWAIRITGWNLSTTLEERHVSSHRDIISALENNMKLERILHYPSFLNLDYSLYVACKFRKND